MLDICDGHIQLELERGGAEDVVGVASPQLLCNDVHFFNYNCFVAANSAPQAVAYGVDVLMYDCVAYGKSNLINAEGAPNALLLL